MSDGVDIQAEFAARLRPPRHLGSVTRDDLVGRFIDPTAPKTKGVLKQAMGGMLFIDEAYYLHHPENQREDLVVILAGYLRHGSVLLQFLPCNFPRAITCAWISAAPSKMLRMRASHSTRLISYSSA